MITNITAKKYRLLLASLGVCALFASTALAQSASEAEFAKSMETYLQNEKNVEKMGSVIEAYFKKKYQKDKQADEQKEIEDQFANPVKVDIGSSYVIGDANAPITIVEFSEFQCPFCKKGSQTMHDILKEYPGKVKIAFKHLPLPFHEQAKPASKAALAAGKQGKFWEMHDKLFENQQALADGLYERLAGELSLNIEQFKTDMANPEIEKQIEEDAQLGSTLGIRGTPGFFVNGVKVSGARDISYFKNIIDRWLSQPVKAAPAPTPAQ